MLRTIYIPIFIALFLLNACTKDELTLPAKVFFDFELIGYEEDGGLKSSIEESHSFIEQVAAETSENLIASPPFPVPAGVLQINRGSLSIETIEFDGRRTEGRDVYFNSNLASPLIVDLETGESNRELSFDIPQGIYERMEFFLTPGGENELPLVLKGRIRKGNDAIFVRFEYRIKEIIRIRAESSGTPGKIVLRRDIPSRAKLVVDAGSIFRFMNPGQFQHADITAYDNAHVILIDPENNPDLFNSLAGRIEKSIRIIFE